MKIVLARIDDRLIHGQVATVWSKATNCQRIIVEAADKLDNTSRTTSANLITGEAGNGGIDITQEAYANSYYYRTSIFNYYLIGGTNKNR